MINGKSVAIILPAYNAGKTLAQVVGEIPRDVADYMLLVDDCSQDDTVEQAHKLGLAVVCHDANRGYGANQKTCYKTAHAWGADIVIMLHPDYQYSPKLIRAMAALIADDAYDVILGSRILGTGALAGGMPLYKYISNRCLTLAENLLVGHKLSEYHTGYRAFSRRALETVNFDDNSDDFVFDNEMLVQCLATGLRLAEVTCPTKYFPGASSINFQRSLVYGMGCLKVGLQYFGHRTGFAPHPMFVPRPEGTLTDGLRGANDAAATVVPMPAAKPAKRQVRRAKAPG